MLKTFFEKLSDRAITPHRATPASVGSNIFTPVSFVLQPQEQQRIFINIAVCSPEEHYAQLMSKSGLMVLYQLEVKAGVIDPGFMGNIGVVLKKQLQQTG